MLSSRRVGSVTSLPLAIEAYADSPIVASVNRPLQTLSTLALVHALRYLCGMRKRKTKNLGGRPKLPDDERRSRQIVVRLTEAEYELLAHRAKRLDSQVSSVVRETIVASLGKL